jgi:hypothetical protein
MDCAICCETFNNSNFLKVDCKGCSGNNFACRTCCKTYILNSFDDPHCIFCKTVWDRDFMNINLTKKFVQKELKLHTENIFLERQMSLLPATQKRASQIKKSRDLIEKRSEILSEIKILKEKVRSLSEISVAYTLEIERLYNGTSTSDTSTKENFTFKCPNGDCKGFLNSKYFCNLCEVKYCKDCMCVKNKEHTCDETIKETVLAIKKSSKPCPGCGEMISKIDGCDQMWCIKCHVQFSWKTGFQITGYNHNPEYFRWLRETQQVILPNPNAVIQPNCGIYNLNEFELLNSLRRIFYNENRTVDYFISVYRFYRHTQVIIRSFENDQEIAERELLGNRVAYLLGDISKERWKILTQRLDKKNKLRKSINNNWNLIETVLLSFLEKLKILLETSNNLIEYKNLWTDIDNFREYINESFIKVADVFSSTTCPGIDKDWFHIANYKEYLKKKLD